MLSWQMPEPLKGERARSRACVRKRELSGPSSPRTGCRPLGGEAARAPRVCPSSPLCALASRPFSSACCCCVMLPPHLNALILCALPLASARRYARVQHECSGGHAAARRAVRARGVPLGTDTQHGHARNRVG